MDEEQPPSALVADKYRLTRLLGRGGMGSVWEGVHVTLGNRVACKFIEPEFVASRDAMQRFENEARAAASLKSKHVVDVYDHGVTADGRPYIVMEFLEGESLDRRIERSGMLPANQVAVILVQVSRALSRAHSVGIVHRDLKPENIFLVWDDEDQTDVAKVVDFGIAKFTDSERSGISSATKTGAILGTPYYMSPEQARGLKNLDARSDNWSLGVIAYEALTGVRPFDGEAVGDLLVKICTTDAPAPSSLNPSLPLSIDEWMKKALGRDPAERFQDVREMAEALLTISGGRTGSTLGAAMPVARGSLPAPLGDATATMPGGTPKKSNSGALTHANLATQLDPSSSKTGKINPVFLWIGAATLSLLAGVGFSLSMAEENDELSAEPPAALAAPSPPAAEPPPVASTGEDVTLPAAQRTPKAATSADVPDTAPADDKQDIPPPPAPPTPAPRPQPVPKQTPPPMPEPLPRPVPRANPAPRHSIDLGY